MSGAAWSAIASIVAALAPILLKLVNRYVSRSSVQTKEDKVRDSRSELAHAIEQGSGDGVAVAFAKHDNIVRSETGTRSGVRQPLGDRTNRQRAVHRLGELVDSETGIRAKPLAETRRMQILPKSKQ